MNNNIYDSLGKDISFPKVNPLDYPSDKCSECGNEVYIPGIIFKNIPGIEFGQGTETVQVPIKVFVCSKCGELSNIDKETLNKKTNIVEPSKNIII